MVGGTHALRASILDRTLDALATTAPAPLVVRIRAPRGTERLSDELPGAVEDALVRLQAPGGLYDDRGPEALRSLGGWLFRARSVGRIGLVLAVDDLDLWTDVRGGAHHDDKWLFSLLRETRERSVSVLASSRSATASGTPGLSAELLSRFDVVHSLGGTLTVTRDPTTVVAALAGRSFSHAGLHRAFERWLDLPTPEALRDDALILFSSPLAPPVFDVSSTPDEALTEAEWRPASEPPAGLTSEPPAARVALWSRGLKGAVTVRECARTLENARFHSASEAERLFTECASRLPMALDAYARSSLSLGADPTALRRLGARALGRFDARFKDVFRHERARWAKGEAHPTLASDLTAKLLRLAEHSSARSTAVVLMPGLRHDLFARLKERVLPLVGALTLVSEGLHWAAPASCAARLWSEAPSSLENVFGEEVSYDPRPLSEAGFAADLQAAIEPVRARMGSLEVHRIDAYACALARPGESLTDAAQSVEVLLPSTLRALCGTLPGPSAVLLAAEVGVGERRVGDAVERTLGGDSAFEVLAPYALLTFG